MSLAPDQDPGRAGGWWCDLVSVPGVDAAVGSFGRELCWATASQGARASRAGRAGQEAGVSSLAMQRQDRQVPSWREAL